jgi:hypothetical protein
MTGVNVRAIAGPQSWSLGDTPCVLPATTVVLAVSGARSKRVMIDGRTSRLSSGSEALLAVDLTRSTGFHRMDIDGRVFWFGTEDAKLGLSGVEAMLAHLGNLGTGWTGQALFSDGAGLRDPHVVYAWLDAWAEQTLAAIEGILASPRPSTESSRELSRRGGPGVLLAPTLRLLRSAPKRYLQASSTGSLLVGNQAYDPLRVVVRKRRTTLETIANRRAIETLTGLGRLLKEVLQNDVDGPTRVRCRLWLNKVESLRRRPLAQALRASIPVTHAPRQAEETTERLYRQSYDAYRDMRRLFGWSPSTALLHRYSYVQRADSIYQAYVASCLAREMELHQTTEILGSEPLAFRGPRFDLYYDTLCPPEVLKSWRASSHFPDQSRPDLLLHERATGRVALIDAKYRLSKNGGASEDSRKDVTSYLGLYGLKNITIVYPGSSQEVSVVTGEGHSIVEVPLVPPASGLVQALPQILSTLAHPPYRSA